MRERHRLFVLEYLIDLNGRAAAKRAGYADKKAAVRACELLRRPDVQAMIREETKARDERLRVSADRIAKEFARIAFNDPTRIASWGPEGVELVPSERLSEDDKAAVKWVSVGGRKGARAQRFLMHDKLSALEDLARILGIFTRGPHGRGAMPEHLQQADEAERAAAVEKVKRLIEGRARAIAEERLKAMTDAGSKPVKTEDE
jgi:phage terminase small subunit